MFSRPSGRSVMTSQFQFKTRPLPSKFKFGYKVQFRIASSSTLVPFRQMMFDDRADEIGLDALVI